MLTFPPQTFESNSTSVPVVFCGNGMAVLNKPSGIPVDEHPWNEGRTTLCGEIRKRLEQGRASLQKLGLSRPAPVILTDSEISGCILLADRENGALELWRNAVGSEQLKFTFVFLCKPDSKSRLGESKTCTLPVAAHFSEPRALISHKTGKKSETRFSPEEKFGEYELWRAETTFPRLHQIRLHAQESGLPIVGDMLYGGVPAVSNAYFGKRGRLNKGEVRPIYPSSCIHLARIEIPESLSGQGAVEISTDVPSGFEALLKKLRSRAPVKFSKE